MKTATFILGYFAIFGLIPVLLAANQPVPTGSAYQQVVLLVSLGAFGLMLGQFWLSRLRTRRADDPKASTILQWHKILGYGAGGVLLLHPVAVIGRRFLVEESKPLDNLLIAIKAPALLPAIIAWILLVLIVLLSLPVARRMLRVRTWRYIHDVSSVAFVGLATWHVVAIGRHSDRLMSAFLVFLACAAAVLLLRARLPLPSIRRGNQRGTAQ